MKINDLEFFLVSVRRTDASTPLQSLLVRLTTTMGVEGWGESALVWRAGELAGRRDALLAVLEGRSIYDIEELHTLEVLSPPPVRCAIEVAIWDALGRSLGQPLCNLLGGFYRQRVPVSLRLAGHRGPQLAPIARELAEQGFHTQTISSTGHPEEDLQTVAAIREIVGNRLELRFDAMANYDMETARDLAARLEPYELQYILDPLSAQKLPLVGSLGRQTSVPLGVWRSLHSAADVLTAVRCNAAGYLVIDIEQVGGIVPARGCAAVASAAGVLPLLGSRPSVGIATAAMLHLAASTAAFGASNELASRQLRDSVLSDPFRVIDGMIAVPQGPGLGITVDRIKLERLLAN